MAKNTTYDIVKAFDAIENELIASMIRNMRDHKLEEIDEKKQWSMWQTEQLKSLEQYRRNNQERIGKDFKQINDNIELLIRLAKDEGEMEQEIEILKAIKKGFKARKVSPGASAEFFKLNERKLDALIKATVEDMQKAETAILRKAEDQYRKIIYNAQVYANTGAGTYEKAVDMATKDMLAAGLNCVEYTNGARHTLKDYANMAIRTASKRAYLQGEGTKRQEWGIATVIVNKRGNPCPKCLPFCGKVLMDDVWSGGEAYYHGKQRNQKPKEGLSPVTGSKYPLMSDAVAAGLYHPNCRDVHTTYFEGINTPPDNKYTKQELNEIAENYRNQQKQQYAKRQEEKFNRLATYSLDPDNKEKYKKKADEWKTKQYSITDDIREHRKDTPSRMVNLVEQYSKDDFVVINDKAEMPFAYNPDTDLVEVNPTHDMFQYYDYRETMIHEIAHRIDKNEFGSPMNLEFVNAILATEKRLLKNADVYKKLFESGGKFRYNELMSDVLGCITDNVIIGSAGHDSQYIGIPGYTELEVFSNIFTALYQGDDETVDFIKEELTDIYRAFMKIVGE